MKTSSPIACVHVPALPIVAHHGTHRATTQPLAVHRGEGTAARVRWCNRLAEEAGVRVGQTLAAARAHVAELTSQPWDPARVASTRHRAVAALLRVTPRVRADGPARFWAEPLARGGDEGRDWAARAGRILEELRPVGVGLGPNATVAYAAARAVREGVHHVSADEADAFLAAAPLEVLEVGGEARAILASLGVRTVGQLRRLDPVSLGMRFGPTLADAWRRAEGFDPRGPTTPRLTPEDAVALDFDDPIDRLDALAFLLGPAVERLARAVRQRDQGVVELELRLRVAPPAAPIEERALVVRCGEPLADPRPLLELLRTRLERERLPAPAIGLRLRVAHAVPHARRSESLPHGAPTPAAGAREVALERIRARLGPGTVRRASRVEVGPMLERARWSPESDHDGEDAPPADPGRLDGAPFDPVPGEALPWRRLPTPARVVDGTAEVAGRRRRVLRLSRVERARGPWWRGDPTVTELVAWAELEGPLLALLRGRFEEGRPDAWEVVAWLD